MNFSEQEPQAGAFYINPEKGYERLHVSESVDAVGCVNGCGTKTRWQNLAFEAPVCSHECVDKLWSDYLAKLTASLEAVQTLQLAADDVQVIEIDDADDLALPSAPRKEETIH